MMHLNKIAKQVMDFFEAFHGSRPALNSKNILIVRSKSRKTIPINQMGKKIDDLKEILNAEEVEPLSTKYENILERLDKNVQEVEKVDTGIDTNGFERMKKELETMGLHLEYKVLTKKNVDIVVAIWEDKTEIGPLYVEVTVSDKLND